MFLDYFLAYNRYANILGIFVVLGIAWLFSKHRSRINYRLVVSGLALHAVLAAFMLKTTVGQIGIDYISAGIASLYRYADQGTAFVFGSLNEVRDPWGFIFAIKVLPIIVFFGALMSVLFYLGIIQRAVGLASKIIQPILGTSGAESLCAVANSFLGQTEAPLLIRHYLGKMTRSELFVVMVSGMGTISGSILAVYAAMGVPAQYLLAASIMAIPSAIVIAKIMIPETEKEVTAHKMVDVKVESSARNALDALAQGTSDGLQLALNVGAMLISFIGIIALVNGLLGLGCTAIDSLLSWCGFSVHVPCLSLQDIFGILFAPFGWLLGLQGDEIFKAGSLIGTKLAINEMVAYSIMLGSQLSVRAIALLSFALCGFANFLSIGIQLGGIGALVPEKRTLLSELGMRAVVGGMLVSILSAFMAGLFL